MKEEEKKRQEGGRRKWKRETSEEEEEEQKKKGMAGMYKIDLSFFLLSLILLIVYGCLFTLVRPATFLRATTTGQGCSTLMVATPPACTSPSIPATSSSTRSSVQCGGGGSPSPTFIDK